jgi:putative ABC transport system permease protein
MNGKQTSDKATGSSGTGQPGAGGRHDPLSPARRHRGDHRFFFTYLARELQRRRRQALLVAVGLAVGVGLVVTVTAASAGVSRAQGAVLHSLYGVGTDVTVTKAAPASNLGSTAKSASASSPFGFTPGKTAQHEDLLEESPGLGVLPASSVASIARLRGVAAVAGGMTLVDTQLTVPSLSQLGPNGQPPTSALTPTTFNVDGVDLNHLGIGPFASAQLDAGRSLRESDANANVAVVDSSYAAANKLTVGSTITIAHVAFKVVGIVDQTQGGGAADVYIPLGRAQALASSPEAASSISKIDTIYVVADSGSEVPMIQREIAKLSPSATVTTASTLASEVSGSLASAASLINDLARWLAGAVLVAAFAVASLLSAAAVARRVREIGTLKALGWRTRRIVAQIMGEYAAIGLVGALLGIAVGFAGAALVDVLAPNLAATVSNNPGTAPAQNVTMGASGVHHSIAQGAQHSIPVHLTASVTLDTVTLAVVLALAGAIIAGSFGAWRAARLRPAQALANLA